MKHLLFVLSFFILTGASALAAESELFPAYYDVVGVAANDHLNLREGPGIKYAIVGMRACNATSIAVVDQNRTGEWGLIRHGEGSAWVSLHYLKRQPGQDDDHLPAQLECGGTEPFWGLTFSPTRIDFDEMGGQKVTLQKVWEDSASGMQPYSFGVRLNNNHSEIHAVISRGRCSDGMSDMTYGFSIHAILSGDLGNRLLSGCCSLP